MTAPTSPQASICSPFDDADADIVFRSSDNIDFRLYKVVIAKASPVFRTMLDLPQSPSNNVDGPGTTAEPAVVKLTEDAKTLENVLRLCYPVEHPTITSVDDVHDVIEAARKYEIASVTANVRWVVMRILPNEPLRIYAMAYILQMEDVAREAANLLLDMPQFHLPASPPPEFGSLPCLAVYAVHIYRQKCVEAALRTLEDRDWVFNGTHERTARYPNGPDSTPDTSPCWIWLTCGSGPNATTMVRLGPRDYYVRKWYEVYLESLKLALMERPSGRTVRSYLPSTRDNEALSLAASCQWCMPKAHADLTRFSELLAERIDDAIAQVKIDLPFTSPTNA